MRTIAILLTLFYSAFSYSRSSIHCKGNINNTWVDSSGLLLISTTWSSKAIGLCRVSTKHNNIEPETCKTWVSIALSALTSKKPTTIQYFTVSSCNEVLGYSSSQQPAYLMIRNE